MHLQRTFERVGSIYQPTYRPTIRGPHWAPWKPGARGGMEFGVGWSLVANHTSQDTNLVSQDTLAFTSNNDPTSEGNHIIIVSGRFGNSGATLTCSDTAGNTYTPVTAQASNSYEIDSGNAGADCAWLFWSPLIHSNVANTVKVIAATGGSHRFTWAVSEWAPGVGNTVALDAGPVATQFGVSSSTLNAGPITTTGSSDLVFIVVQTDIVQTSGYTNNAPWTAFEGTSYAATNRAVGQYRLNLGAGSYTGSITPTANSSGSGIAIAFKAFPNPIGSGFAVQSMDSVVWY